MSVGDFPFRAEVNSYIDFALNSMLKTMNFVMRIIQGATHEVYRLCEGKDFVQIDVDAKDYYKIKDSKDA